jgi:CheY-like chemotaxis protein
MKAIRPKFISNPFRSQKKIKALVVHPDVRQQVQLARAIDTWVESIDMTDNAEEAFTLSSFMHYQLIIMDLNLPRYNGFELAEKIRSFPLGLDGQTFIIGLSSLNHPVISELSDWTHFDEIVPKSTTPRGLRTIIINHFFLGEN